MTANVKTNHMSCHNKDISNNVKFALEGELHRKINLWSNKPLVPSQPFSEICFHDNQM